MNSGYSWLCQCGWSTHRTYNLDHVEIAREAHIRHHQAAIQNAARQQHAPIGGRP